MVPKTFSHSKWKLMEQMGGQVSARIAGNELQIRLGFPRTRAAAAGD